MAPGRRIKIGYLLALGARCELSDEHAVFALLDVEEIRKLKFFEWFHYDPTFYSKKITTEFS